MQTHRDQYTINDSNDNNKNILLKKIQFPPLENNKNAINVFDEINQAIISNDTSKLIDLINSNSKHIPNVCSNSWETPLFLCIDFDNSKALNILLKNCVDCNIQNNDGNTPLHMAIIKNKENCINVLLDNRANPNIANKVKIQTPFHLAVINKVNENILQKFKRNNADWNIKDKDNKTPFDYALELNDNNYLSLLNDIFDRKDNNSSNIYYKKKSISEVNSCNFKSLPNYNNSYKLIDKIKSNNDENKENINFYNIKGETNANTMSEIYSPRDNNTKKNMISFRKENVIEENTNNNILKDFSLSESNYYKLSNNSFLINEKDFERKKYQSLVNEERNDLMKKIIMDTVKKINKCQTNKNTFENNIKSSSMNELNQSEINHLGSKISTVLDETINSNFVINNRNNSTFMKTEIEDNSQLLNKECKNDNKDGELIIIKDSLNNSSNNETLNENTSKHSYNLNKLKNNSNSRDMKYMIIQQIKEKSKKIELGSPSTIPNEILTNLKYWLISCDLINYYNLLIEKHLYNIDELISDIKNKKVKIDYKFVEELGIKKPGHIFRFLLKLQMDADILDKEICYYIIEKYNNNNNTNTILLNSSFNDIKCCGVSCFSHSPCSSEVSS